MNWTTVLEDATSSGTTLEKEKFTFPESEAWKIRLVGKGNSNNDWNSVTELSWREVITSTSSYESSNLIDVFPNPSSGYVTIDSRKMISKVNVLNIIGHRVLDVTINEESGVMVNVSSLSKGVYLIEVMF